MKNLRYLIILFLTLTIHSSHLKAQVPISDIINIYTEVTALGTDNQDVTVTDISGFHVRDTVLLVQMKGVGIPDLNNPVADNTLTVGKYEFLLVRSVNIPEKKIAFTESFQTYDPDEPVQLIRVPGYQSAKITGKLTCRPWNGKTGGILSFVAKDSVLFNNNIDVSAKGFRGASPGADLFNHSCYHQSDNLSYITENSTDSAGRKGEGIISVHFPYTKGTGKVENGGGGGGGKFSGGGGGGGASIHSGGIGGIQTSECIVSNDTVNGGIGGKITNYIFDKKDRLLLGGGGGTGTQNSQDTATSGGNGGGAVIILTQKIIGNNDTICSNGENAKGIATAGAGGGGGGGMVTIDAVSFSKDINIECKGGNGGNTNNTYYQTGPGGGGGGGSFNFSGSTLPGNIKLKLTGGNAGINLKSTVTYHATNGNPAILSEGIYSVILPINGFLFNTIASPQTICYQQIPDTLNGSQPRGGNGEYTYSWQKRTKNTTWTEATGVNNQMNYAPPALTDSTYFMRIVTSGSVVDTSTEIEINVIPEIKNNLITADQTICQGQQPKNLNGSTANGGYGTLAYQWESKTLKQTTWNIPDGGTNINYAPTVLNDTTLYRRKVISTINSKLNCIDLSDTVKMNVLHLISGNNLTPDQTICFNQKADTLKGKEVLQGGTGLYKYNWQQSSDASNWIPSAGNNSVDYYAGAELYNTINYRRIVYSGNDSCCKDTSKLVTVTVLPKITNNQISGNDLICEGHIPIISTGSLPSGGSGIYQYSWFRSYDANNWQPANSPNHLQDFQSDTLHTTSYFKRVAVSGLNQVCRDTSTSIKVQVLPALVNTLLSHDSIICFGGLPKLIAGKVATGGDNSNYTYNWQTSKDQKTWTTTGANQPSFQPSTLSDSTYFRRTVTSSVCTDSSAQIKIAVLPAIQNNILPNDHNICYNTSDTLKSSTPTYGNTGQYAYSWQQSPDAYQWSATGQNTRDFYTGPLTSVTFYRRIVKSGLNDCCQDISQKVTVGINPLPAGSISTLDDTICKGESRTLNFNLSGNNPFTLVYSDGTSSYHETGITKGNPWAKVVQPALSSSYTITSLLDKYGCSATDKQGMAKIKVYEVPKANAGITADTCGPVYKLKAIPSVGTGTWSTPYDVVFIDKNDPNTRVEVNKYGVPTFTWTEINGICKDSDKVTVTFYEQPHQAMAGNDTVLHYRFETNMKALTPNAGTGTWTKVSGSGTISDPNSPTSLISDLKFGESKFLWTVINGSCPVTSDTVTLTIKDIKSPKGFSPNNDGKNDKFVILGLDNSKSNELTVFNRSGIEIFKADNYQNDWDGTDHWGKPVPEDTYYYVLKVDEKFSYSGYVVIKR